MTTRQKFQDDLEELRLNILDLAKIVEGQSRLALESLVNQNIELANTVVTGDQEVDDLQYVIEKQCVRLIATQQPLARDLRKLVAGFKISIYLERMGDLAVDLAKLTLRIGNETLIKPLIDIPRMHALVQEMLEKGLKAYIREDCDGALEMALMDDQVDHIYSELFDELKDIMIKEPFKVHQANYLIFACRFLERSGDYCTNIAEEIIYLCTGQRRNLNE